MLDHSMTASHVSAPDDLHEARARSREVEVLDVVCHDLKDPLAAIVMGSAFLLKTLPQDGANDVRVRRLALAMQRSADRMNRLVKNMLDYTRLERGRIELKRAEHELGALVDGAALRLSAAAAEKGVRIVCDVLEPGRRIWCDRERIEEAIVQLGTNAVRYTKAPNEVTLRARGDDATASVTVTDHGPGIKADRVAHLFDAEYHMRQLPRDGTGLGLAIAHGLAVAHGGALKLDHTGESGSALTITIPSR